MRLDTEEISQPNLNYGFRVRPGAAEIQTRNSSDVQMSILLGRDSQHPLTEVVSSELDKSTASLRTRLRTADAEACKARQWRGCMEEHIGQNVETTGMKYHEGPKARGLTSELARSVANRSKGESMRQLLSFEQKGCKRW
ncbi:unnamed protein product [Protopolystoma xenopodis]|uniref:Uncharacterized protein n=1 Tax=Protopolystoma xenopodis TaxID=117903 RepID=A0A448XEG1_9PLAT|nr:unnamed protein product [Protopolystoma xenopodis]